MPDVWPSEVHTAVTGLSKKARLFEDLISLKCLFGKRPRHHLHDSLSGFLALASLIPTASKHLFYVQISFLQTYTEAV